jgi:hypothetical protein
MAALDLDLVPFVVAYPLAHAREGGTARDRIDNALFAAYQAMRLAGLTLLSAYLEDDLFAPDLDDALGRLEQAQWGSWRDLVKHLARHFAEGEGRSSRWHALTLPLAEAWRRVDGDRASSPLAHLLEPFAGVEAARARSPFDALARLRNDRAHRAGTVDRLREARDAELLPSVLALVEGAVAELWVATELSLGVAPAHAQAAGRAALLGPKTPALPREPVLSLARLTPTDTLPLRLVAALEPPAAPDDTDAALPHDPILLLDELRRATATFLGVHRALVRPHPALAQAMEARRSPLCAPRDLHLPTSRRTARLYAAAALRGAADAGAFRPAAHLVRPVAARAFERAIERGGAALLLVGDAGSGKGAMLSWMAHTLLGTPRDLVVLCSGQSLPATQRHAVFDHLAKALHAARCKESPRELVELVRVARGNAPTLGGLVDALGTEGEAALADARSRLARLVLPRLGLDPATTDLLPALRAVDAALGAEAAEPGAPSAGRLVLLLGGLDDAADFEALLRVLDELAGELQALPRVRLVATARLASAARLAHVLRPSGWVHSQRDYSDKATDDAKDLVCWEAVGPLSREEQHALLSLLGGASPPLAARQLVGKLPSPLHVRLALTLPDGAHEPPADELDLVERYHRRLPGHTRKALRAFVGALRDARSVTLAPSDGGEWRADLASSLDLLRDAGLVASVGAEGWSVSVPLLAEATLAVDLRGPCLARGAPLAEVLAALVREAERGCGEGAEPLGLLVRAVALLLRWLVVQSTAVPSPSGAAPEAVLDAVLDAALLAHVAGVRKELFLSLARLIPNGAAARGAAAPGPTELFAARLGTRVREASKAPSPPMAAWLRRLVDASAAAGAVLWKTGQTEAAATLSAVRMEALEALLAAGEPEPSLAALVVRERRLALQSRGYGPEVLLELDALCARAEALAAERGPSSALDEELAIALSVRASRERPAPVGLLERAVALLEPLAAREGATPRQRTSLAIAQSKLSAALVAKGASPSPDAEARSEALFEQAVRALSELEARSPRDYGPRRNLAITLAVRGTQRSQAKRFEEAERALRQAVERLEELVREHGGVPDLERDLAMNRAYLAIALREQGQLPEAMALHARNLVAMEQLARANRWRFAWGYSSALHHAAETADRAGDEATRRSIAARRLPALEAALDVERRKPRDKRSLTADDATKAVAGYAHAVAVLAPVSSAEERESHEARRAAHDAGWADLRREAAGKSGGHDTE